MVCAMERIRYPHIEIALAGESPNPLAIAGRTLRALRESGVPQEAQFEYLMQAFSGDYGHLLRTTLQTVRCK